MNMQIATQLIIRVFSPIRERADNLSLMKKHCFFTVFMKLQNNDIITFLKILQDYIVATHALYKRNIAIKTCLTSVAQW